MTAPSLKREKSLFTLGDDFTKFFSVLPVFSIKLSAAVSQTNSLSEDQGNLSAHCYLHSLTTYWISLLSMLWIVGILKASQSFTL